MGYWLVIVFIRALFLGDIGREGRVSERSVIEVGWIVGAI